MSNAIHIVKPSATVQNALKMVVYGDSGVGKTVFAATAPKPAAPAAQTARPAPAAVGKISTPKEVFGHNVGDDYFLANYKQEYDYFQMLAKQSNRIHIQDIGKSSEGRPMITAVITAPENYAKLARYKEISRKLSTNDVKDDAEARAQYGLAVDLKGGRH